MPITKLLATRMPIKPPAPTMDRSNITVIPSLSSWIPEMFGTQLITFPAASLAGV